MDLIDAELPGAQEAGTDEEITTLEDEILPAAAVAETVALDDEELPAAAEVEEGAQIWWWWILLLIAAIVAYSIYRYNKNRKNQENA